MDQACRSGNVAWAQDNLGFMHHMGEGGLVVDHIEAARLYKLAADQGYASAQYNLGCSHRDGAGVPQDLAEAARLFLLAAEQGHDGAQADMAKAYIFGKGVAQDYAAALQWARRSAAQGDGIGEANLGVLHAYGWGVPRDGREAARLFESAAKKGHEHAKKNLRVLALDGVSAAASALRRLGLAVPAGAAAAIVTAGGCPLGNVAEQRAALEKWGVRRLKAIRAAAEGGDLAAQHVLGDCFYFGSCGAQKDAAQAIEWFKRAEASNVAMAQCQLGFMYDRGEGSLAVDKVEAARLYKLAADQGYTYAQYNLGLCNRKGEGVSQDLAEAARLFLLAAEQGDADAQAEVATAYMFGDGVAQDYAAALQWSRRSAAQRNCHPRAIVTLATLHEHGWGVPRNKLKAVRLYEAAVTGGAIDTTEDLRRLAEDGDFEVRLAARAARLRLKKAGVADSAL